MKPITWDIAIISVFLVFLLFCLLIRKHKALSALVSVYISYVITVNWGDKLAGLFTGDRVLFGLIWFKISVPSHLIYGSLFLILCLLIIIFAKFSGKRSFYSTLEISVYVMFAVSLGIVFLLAFFPSELRMKVIENSKILPVIYKFKEYIVLVPLFVIVFFGMYGSDE